VICKNQEGLREILLDWRLWGFRGISGISSDLKVNDQGIWRMVNVISDFIPESMYI